MRSGREHLIDFLIVPTPSPCVQCRVTLIMQRTIEQARTPTTEEARLMLRDMRLEMGSQARASVVLGVSPWTLDSWMRGRRGPRTPARRMIWFVWSIAFNPENLIPLLSPLPRTRRGPIPDGLRRFAPRW